MGAYYVAENHSFKETFKRMNGMQSQEGKKNKSMEKNMELGEGHGGGGRINREANQEKTLEPPSVAPQNMGWGGFVYVISKGTKSTQFINSKRNIFLIFLSFIKI